MNIKKLSLFLVSISSFIFFIWLVIHLEDFTNYVFRMTKFKTPYIDFTIGIVVFFCLTLIVFLLKRKEYLIIWLIKSFITLIFMISYEYIYPIDANMYYARAIGETIPELFGSSGTANVMYINHYFTYIVGNSYYSLKILNSFIGFLGLIFLYLSYEFIIIKSKLTHTYNNKFIYIFFLFPTILFWSSILGKDPLNLFFIGLFSYGFIHLLDNFNFRYLLIIIISILLVSYIRSWWSVIMVTSIFLYYLKIDSIKSFILFIIVAPIFYIIAMQFLQTQGIASFNEAFLIMAETSAKLSGSGTSLGSSVGVHEITGIGDYLLYYIPNLFTSLYRPMPWDIRNPFTLMAAVENVILFYLSYKYIFKKWKDIYGNKYVRFYIVLIFSWSLLYVIISPTNLGIAVRFKLQVLPAMLVLIGVAMAMNDKRDEEKKAKTKVDL